MQDQPPDELYARFKVIRTSATGVMGYLAMLEVGDFAGGEQKIVDDLRPAVNRLTTKLEELRDMAASRSRHAGEGLERAVIATILASEPRIRLSLQALDKRLASSVVGWPKSEWTDTLRVIQAVIREVKVIYDAFEVASAEPAPRTV